MCTLGAGLMPRHALAGHGTAARSPVAEAEAGAQRLRLGGRCARARARRGPRPRLGERTGGASPQACHEGRARCAEAVSWVVMGELGVHVQDHERRPRALPHLSLVCRPQLGSPGEPCAILESGEADVQGGRCSCGGRVAQRLSAQLCDSQVHCGHAQLQAVRWRRVRGGLWRGLGRILGRLGQVSEQGSAVAAFHSGELDELTNRLGLEDNVQRLGALDAHHAARRCRRRRRGGRGLGPWRGGARPTALAAICELRGHARRPSPAVCVEASRSVSDARARLYEKDGFGLQRALVQGVADAQELAPGRAALVRHEALHRLLRAKRGASAGNRHHWRAAPALHRRRGAVARPPNCQR
mmetsp:Transcript_18516/g.58488  ORF Transcript_18516/g.58488 Transcript_18516/m.58488 type:complete len:356 (+) Transcript_18516:2478-3545(+)